MNKEEIILVGLATGKGSSFSPVQVQKLFFLFDKNPFEKNYLNISTPDIYEQKFINNDNMNKFPDFPERA